MRRIVKVMIIMGLFLWAVSLFSLIPEKKMLQEKVIRLHVVANSNSDSDQQIKLQVRDAVLSYLEENVQNDAAIDEIKAFLNTHLHELEAEANTVLRKYDSGQTATVCLQKEAFPAREYTTFSLPSGVYESLSIRIGTAEGRNWWCVIFPSLCLEETTEAFREIAAEAGLTDTMIHTVTGENGCAIRFFLLDCLGKLENIFYFR